MVATCYNKLLQKSIAVVACNKVACSSAYSYYQQLKESAREFNAKFLFETNVGAGLPIIGTLNDLISSGDKINKMQAVLSGTLNFVFNNYDGKKSFASGWVSNACSKSGGIINSSTSSKMVHVPFRLAISMLTSPASAIRPAAMSSLTFSLLVRRIEPIFSPVSPVWL